MEEKKPVIHTMPEKFLTNQPKNVKQTSPAKDKKESRIKKLLPLIIIVITLLIIIGGVSFYLFYTLQETPAPTEVPVESSVISNLNANANINSDVDADANVNTDTTNVNYLLENTNISNDNNNVNLNENINVNTNLNIPARVKNSLDSDNDLLTDVEEALYQTKPQKPDSDSDGYIDGQELIAGYNPMGAGLIIDAKVVDSYSNKSYPYRIYYPQSWRVDPLNQEESIVLFTADNGEFIEVTVTENKEELAALNWYLSLYPDLKEDQVRTIVNLNDLEGVESLQGYTIYFNDDKYIYSIKYSFGSKTEIDFMTTFEMIYNNFKIKSST